MENSTDKYGKSIYTPNIPMQDGYPVSPGYHSIRKGSGGLKSEFAVQAPTLSDNSQWQALKNQQLDVQNLRGTDALRKGMAQANALPAQGGASLNSGSRGIAALQGMGQAQEGFLSAPMQNTQSRLGMAEELLGKNFDLEKMRGGLSQAAEAANLQAELGDIKDFNRWKGLQYENALAIQQSKDMLDALRNQGKGGPSDIAKVAKNPLRYIPGVTWNPLLEQIPGVSNVVNDVASNFERSDLNPANWF